MPSDSVTADASSAQEVRKPQHKFVLLRLAERDKDSSFTWSLPTGCLRRSGASPRTPNYDLSEMCVINLGVFIWASGDNAPPPAAGGTLPGQRSSAQDTPDRIKELVNAKKTKIKFPVATFLRGSPWPRSTATRFMNLAVTEKKEKKRIVKEALVFYSVDVSSKLTGASSRESEGR